MTTRHPHATPEPLDEAAVLRDDVLVDAMAKGVLPMEYADDALVRELLLWREDIVTTGAAAETATLPACAEQKTQLLPALPTATSPRPAATSLRPGTAPGASRPEGSRPGVNGRRRPTTSTRVARSWLKRPLAITAAIVAVAFGSLGSMAAANTAQPGSVLWPIAKVVNGDRAQSLEAREEALTNLREARAEVARNNTSEARARLEEAMTKASDVREGDGKGELNKEVKAVQGQITAAEKSPEPSKSPSPSPSESPSPSPSASPSPSGSPSPSATVTVSPSVASSPVTS